MKQFFIIIALFATTPANADPPTKIVGSEQQATRDNEKLTILQNELNKQKQIATQLQQKRAIDLTNDNKENLTTTEARLEEVSGNVAMIQQEINLTKNSPVTVRLNQSKENEPTKIAQKEVEQPGNSTGPWWDLYNKKKN
jgi:hypothetical protein